MSRTVLAGIVGMMIVSAAGPGMAQTLPSGGPTAEEVAAWLTQQGLDTVVDGDQVRSGANGVAWDMTGFDCVAGRCQSWQFSAGFQIAAMTEGAVERWNQQRRYLKAFELERPEGTAAVAQYDVLITPGMTWEGMTEHMRLFASVAPLFALEMGAIREE
ncbi:MAG: YbjN domain-containing protein [Caulobacterales bacterium]|nr:YbjN domain-containing protein [Caulobacterales bacterium]